MKKTKVAFIVIGFIVCATIGRTFYGTTLTHADTKIQTIKNKSTVSTEIPSNSTTIQPVTTTKQPENIQNNSSVTNVSAQNFISFNNPGPIEHYVWNHQGQKDEVWQNTKTGEWRTEKKLPDGSSQKSIYKNGFLYFMANDANGHLLKAEKIAESSSYNGKGDAFNGFKVDESSFTYLGNSTISNVPVKILQKEDQQVSNTAETTKLYMDTIHDLPLLAEHIVNGQITGTETWNYSYMQDDARFFAVPTNVKFQYAPSTDTPQGNK